jgi:pyruvate/2-oxoacid:ferredoxin oxidoreductase alpha subunit
LPFQHTTLRTAVTRARKLVVLVGTLKAVATAVRNMDARRRVTLLRQRLWAPFHASLTSAVVAPLP